MVHYYFDSSALAKRYIAETGSAWINDIVMDDEHTLYTVRVSGAEIVAAFFRRVRTESLTPANAQAAAAEFKNDFRHRYQIVEVTEQLVDTAMTLAETHNLRGYDSIQLAAALVLQRVRTSLSASPIVFVCADQNLNEAAIAEGLPVENPNDHADV